MSPSKVLSNENSVYPKIQKAKTKKPLIVAYRTAIRGVATPCQKKPSAEDAVKVAKRCKRNQSRIEASGLEEVRMPDGGRGRSRDNYAGASMV
jgi:hypothetical protein